LAGIFLFNQERPVFLVGAGVVGAGACVGFIAVD
jgi:hypothetical protein